MFSTCMLCSHRLLCFCAMLMQAFSLCVLCSHIFVHAAVFTLRGDGLREVQLPEVMGLERFNYQR